MYPDRRDLLRGLALGILAATGGYGLARADPGLVPEGLGVPLPPAPGGVLSRLPTSSGNMLALTIDDGTSTEVVAAYATLCRDADLRLTFFPNGVYRSWTDNAPLIRPMVESGQILLGNHTWSHPVVTKLSPADLTDQINRNDDFLRNTYGVSGRPYFRPPYGTHNAQSDRIATDLGYRTITLWTESLGDGRIVTAPDVVTAAGRAFAPGNIVLGHANQRVIPSSYPQLVDLIHARNLRTVTLADVFTP